MINGSMGDSQPTAAGTNNVLDKLIDQVVQEAMKQRPPQPDLSKLTPQQLVVLGLKESNTRK